MSSPWDGLLDGAAFFIFSHAVLAIFFSSEMISHDMNQNMWIGLTLFGSLYLIWRLVSMNSKRNDNLRIGRDPQHIEDGSEIRLLDDEEERGDIDTNITNESKSSSRYMVPIVKCIFLSAINTY